jgi:hypothetical protein
VEWRVRYDIYCTVLYRLQLSDWRWTLWSETCTGRKIFWKNNITFNRSAFCRFKLCDYITSIRCVTTQNIAVLSPTLSTTLTEVSPYFLLSCTANARVNPAKTGHGPHSSYFLCCSMYFLCVVLCIVCFVSFSVLFVCICVLYYCHRVATQLQLNISYHIKISHELTQDSMRPTAVRSRQSHDTALMCSYTLIISPWCMQMLHVIYGI